MNADQAYIASIIANANPLPKRLQKIGASEVQWWEGKPGDAVIMASGGTLGDRILAENAVKDQLFAFGYKRATFHFALLETPEQGEVDSGQAEHRQDLETGSESGQTAIDRRQENQGVQDVRDGWAKVMEKAKRLINTGNVQVVRNGVNNIVAQVKGDHGDYTVEIGRDDPNSNAITTWKCECPWDQYAWQRTRKWKKYEGRPCSHVLAAYWQSGRLPIDEEYDPESAAAKADRSAPSENKHGPYPGGTEMPPAPAAGEVSPFGEQIGTETGAIPKPVEPLRGLYKMNPPGPQEEQVEKRFLEQYGIPGPDTDQRSFSPEPEPTDARYQDAGVIPKSPVEIQQEELEAWNQRRDQFSMPGKRGPSPLDPLQQMNTFSSVRESADTPGWYRYNNGDIIQLKENVNIDGIHIPAGTNGSVLNQERNGKVMVLFDDPEQQERSITGFVEPSKIEPGSNKEDLVDPLVGDSAWDIPDFNE